MDKVFLRENDDYVNFRLKKKVMEMEESGFLVLDSLPGPKFPLQTNWYNRCSKPDMGGASSWVAFIDLDEFLVVLDKYAIYPQASSSLLPLLTKYRLAHVPHTFHTRSIHTRIIVSESC